MLEINNDICILKEDEASVEKVFNSFFEINSNIIYIVDEDNKFVGTITSGQFLKYLKENEETFINQSSLWIILKDEKEMLEEAVHLFKERHITTAIPVLDQKKGIYCEIRLKRQEPDEEKQIEFQEKLIKYEKSHYVGEEIVKIRRVLATQDIIVIGTEEQFKCICGKLFLDTQRVTFIKKLDHPYEFLCSNKKLLIDVSLSDQTARRELYESCCLGYVWEEFLYMILYIVEGEYCDRFFRIVENEHAIAKEYIEKYWDREIIVPLKGIFAFGIRKYLQKAHFKLIMSDKLCREEFFCINHQENGVVHKVRFAKDLMVLDYIDQIIQLYYLSRRLCDEDMSVLNFAYDDRAYLTNEERARIEKKFDFNEYVLEMRAAMSDKKSLYQGNAYDVDGLEELNRDLSFFQLKRFENDLILYRDYESRLVNIENGLRKTYDQPVEYIGTIYCFGPCVIYGLYVEDRYTIPSIIQRHINRSGKKYRVVNMGNQIQVNGFRLLETLDITRNDIFVFFFHSIVGTIEKNISVIEIGEQFNQLRKTKYRGKDCFFDGVLHCGDYGNIIYADIIYNQLKECLSDDEKKCLYKNSVYNVFKKNEVDLETLYGWDSYIEELLEKKKMRPIDSKKIGCIVVNCNPFTKGHRYLVEYALNVVDYLYVFVLEEDRSFFSFRERYEMVKRGLSDLNNVMIIRSGKFIISSATFPAYFQKEKIKNGERISLNEDLRVFSQYIAHILDIQYRFVGEEKQDYVTNQYNKAMKRILPQFGIQVIEIARKCTRGNAISASKVREYYYKKNFNDMQSLVPGSTLDYLKKKCFGR